MSRFETRPGIWAPERWLNDEMFDRMEALERFGAERGLSLLQVALGGTAAMPAVASVIAGATRPEQVKANVAAAEWTPSGEDLAALRELCAPTTTPISFVADLRVGRPCDGIL